MKREIITVGGRVQGVGFRYTILGIAPRYAVAGTVRNLRSGEKLEIDVEGEPEQVDAFVRDVLANPPSGARIAGVERRAAEPRRLAAFAAAPTA